MSFHCAAKLNGIWQVTVRFDKLGLSGFWRDEHGYFVETSAARDQSRFKTRSMGIPAAACLWSSLLIPCDTALLSTTLSSSVYFKCITPISQNGCWTGFARSIFCAHWKRSGYAVLTCVWPPAAPSFPQPLAHTKSSTHARLKASGRVSKVYAEYREELHTTVSKSINCLYGTGNFFFLVTYLRHDSGSTLKMRMSLKASEKTWAFGSDLVSDAISVGKQR